MKCARTACNADANPLLVHCDTGEAYCPRCARQINKANSGLGYELIPWPNKADRAEHFKAKKEKKIQHKMKVAKNFHRGSMLG